jgi:hypothetical protein
MLFLNVLRRPKNASGAWSSFICAVAFGEVCSQLSRIVSWSLDTQPVLERQDGLLDFPAFNLETSSDNRERDFMSPKNACVLRVISTLLVIGLVLVAMPSPDMARAGDKNRKLTQASMDGDVEKVTSLLDSGADVNARDLRGWTPLLWAVKRGQMDLVKLFLDNGADVNAKGEHGWTPLMEAANRGHSEATKLLLKKGADVNLKHEYAWTALKIAKGKGNKEIVALLKAHGAKK